MGYRARSRARHGMTLRVLSDAGASGGLSEIDCPLATCLRLGEERARFMRDARSEVRGGRCEREKGRTSPFLLAHSNYMRIRFTWTCARTRVVSSQRAQCELAPAPKKPRCLKTPRTALPLGAMFYLRIFVEWDSTSSRTHSRSLTARLPSPLSKLATRSPSPDTSPSLGT